MNPLAAVAEEQDAADAVEAEARRVARDGADGDKDVPPSARADLPESPGGVVERERPRRSASGGVPVLHLRRVPRRHEPRHENGQGGDGERGRRAADDGAQRPGGAEAGDGQADAEGGEERERRPRKDPVRPAEAAQPGVVEQHGPVEDRRGRRRDEQPRERETGARTPADAAQGEGGEREPRPAGNPAELGEERQVRADERANVRNAGLVTCGDADVARYALGRRFFAASRARGLSVVWRSFPNRPHDVPEASARLAREFLAHHHWAHPEDLGGAPVPSPPAPFVGDDADDVYFPSDSPAASAVLPEDRVELPSETVAAAWGTPGLAADGGRREPRVSARTFRGVEVVFSVPDGVRADARVLVLLGGRGWTGAQALRDLGFADWALARGWCLLAPSFGDGGRDSRAAAEALSSALGDLRRRHGLRPYPVFLYGYSAGGELAALLQARPPFPVAAWAVHGCGVFPEAFRADAPALVSCGVGDEGRFGLSRTFACRYREAGGLLVWRTAWGGHEPDAGALALARELFAAVSAGAPCALWGEDDTRRVLPRARIDPEYANPLYTPAMAERWRRE